MVSRLGSSQTELGHDMYLLPTEDRQYCATKQYKFFLKYVFCVHNVFMALGADPKVPFSCNNQNARFLGQPPDVLSCGTSGAVDLKVWLVGKWVWLQMGLSMV